MTQLTLAQQHADELAHALERMWQAAYSGDKSKVIQPDEFREFAGLRAKIKPPEPPTLVEALAELEAICSSHDDESEYAAMQRAGALLDRARRAGLL